jgi:hypothetical protein
VNSVIGSYSSCGTYKKSTKKCDLSTSFSLKERICNLKYGDEENFRKVLNICTLLIWNLCFKLMCVFDIPSVLNNPFLRIVLFYQKEKVLLHSGRTAQQFTGKVSTAINRETK